MGNGVSKEELDAQMHRVGELEQLIAKKTGDSDELQRQLNQAKKKCVETQERCLKELSDLPDEEREAQIKECIKRHGLDPSKLNVMEFGSVKAGKSTFGSYLVGKKPMEGGFKAGVTPVQIGGASESRESVREEFEGRVVIYDTEGTGCEGNESRKAVKERLPAAFDLVLIMIDKAAMNEDVAMAKYCQEWGIPWRFVQSRMDRMEDSVEDTEETVEEVKEKLRGHVRESLKERQITFEDHMLLFVNGRGKGPQYEEGEVVNMIRRLAEGKQAQ